MIKKDITHLFCFVADFVDGYAAAMEARALVNGSKFRKPTRVPGLADAEIVTIILMFQESPSKNFKYFYQSYLQSYNNDEFHNLPTYERFVTLMQRALPILLALLGSLLSTGNGIGFIDATSLAVCHAKRISSHKVFDGIAARGKTTKGWFFGLKLHLIINEKGELINVALTRGNTDDRTPVPKLTEKFAGLLCGDKGYISKSLFAQLYDKGVKLVTGIKKNMKNCLMDMHEKMILRKRSLIETVFSYLKNTMQLEHTRHRSPLNALIHILSTLVAYQLKPTKPSAYFSHVLPS